MNSDQAGLLFLGRWETNLGAPAASILRSSECPSCSHTWAVFMHRWAWCMASAGVPGDLEGWEEAGLLQTVPEGK